MAKLLFCAGLFAFVAVLVLSQNEVLAAPAVVAPVKDLLLSVNRVGDRTEQVVDNQQGQVVKQTVFPGGIRQTVTRNGVVITDDVVKRPVL